MWCLKGRAPETLRYLSEPGEYQVGRSASWLTLPGDRSVSRSHAKFFLADDGKLFVEDFGSRYGTRIAGQRLEDRTRIAVNDGDAILFGMLSNEWRATKVTFETLAIDCEIPARYHTVDQWSPTCTHLTMTSFPPDGKNSFAIASALITGRFIVTPDFWNACEKSISELTSLPNEADFIPDVRLCPDPKRETLFCNKIFLFATEMQLSKYSPLIRASGGFADLLKAQSPSPEVIVMLESLPDRVANHLHAQKRRPIPEAEISLAIVHVSIEEYCNPTFGFKSPSKSLSLKDSATFSKKRHTVCENETPAKRRNVDDDFDFINFSSPDVGSLSLRLKPKVRSKPLQNETEDNLFNFLPDDPIAEIKKKVEKNAKRSLENESIGPLKRIRLENEKQDTNISKQLETDNSHWISCNDLKKEKLEDESVDERVLSKLKELDLHPISVVISDKLIKKVEKASSSTITIASVNFKKFSKVKSIKSQCEIIPREKMSVYKGVKDSSLRTIGNQSDDDNDDRDLRFEILERHSKSNFNTKKTRRL